MKCHVYHVSITCKRFSNIFVYISKPVFKSSIHMTRRWEIFPCSVSDINYAPIHRRKEDPVDLVAEHPGKKMTLPSHSFVFNTKRDKTWMCQTVLVTIIPWFKSESFQELLHPRGSSITGVDLSGHSYIKCTFSDILLSRLFSYYSDLSQHYWILSKQNTKYVYGKFCRIN